MEESLVVNNVSKTFRIYHEKKNSIYETVFSLFDKKNHFEELPILKKISFKVNKGEMVGILGKNGVGKTTLLRIIANIYKPDSGSITVNGTLMPFLALGSGFQPELTASANVIQYGMLLGVSKKNMIRDVEKIIKFAELEKFHDIKLKNFSAGMYARLAFATAVHMDPDILLMDEIISVGDLSFQQKCYDVFLDFKKRGKSIILVTHSMEPVIQYCDRAILLNNGEIVAEGKPDMVVKEYQKIQHVEKV